MMVDTSTVPPEKPKPSFEMWADRTQAAARTVIGGQPVAAVRRIVLYTVVELCLLLAPVWIGFVVVGAIAVMLLMATDVYR